MRLTVPAALFLLVIALPAFAQTLPARGHGLLPAQGGASNFLSGSDQPVHARPAVPQNKSNTYELPEQLNNPGQESAMPPAVGTETLNLQSQSQPSVASSAPPIDLKDVPQSVLDEMDEVEKNCHENYFYSSFHDCRCIAVKYLDARMHNDPSMQKDTVFGMVSDQCIDEVSVAGYMYTNCANFMKTSRSDYETFCTCTADNIVKAFMKAPMMNLRYIESLQKNAFIACGIANNPDNQSPR